MDSSPINDLNCSHSFRFISPAFKQLFYSNPLGVSQQYIQSSNKNTSINELTLTQENDSKLAKNSNPNELIARIEKLLAKIKAEISHYKDDIHDKISKMDYLPLLIEKDDDKKVMHIFESLGQGSYGKVEKCTVDGTMYCAYKLFKNELKDKLEIYYKLLQGQYPNVATIVGYGSNTEGYYLLLELGLGTLLDLIEYLIRYDQKLTLPQVLILIKKITLGIRSLHQSYIVHRDLKPDNILIFNHECIVKISDFSNACIFDEDANIPYQLTGNGQYRLPEVNKLKAKTNAKNIKEDILQMGEIFDALRKLVCNEEVESSEILRNIIEMTKNPNPLLEKCADDIINFIDMIITDKRVIHKTTIELLYIILKTSEELKIMKFKKDVSKWLNIAANYKNFGLRINYTLHILNSFFFNLKLNDQSIFTDDIVKMLLWGIPYWIIQHGIKCLHVLVAILKKLNSIKDDLDDHMLLYHFKALDLTAEVTLNIRPGQKNLIRVIKKIKEKFRESQEIDNEKDTLTKLIVSSLTYNIFKRIYDKCIFEKWDKIPGRFIKLYRQYSNSKPQLIALAKLIEQHLETFIIETTDTGGPQAVAAVLPKGFDSFLYEQIIKSLIDTTQRFRFSQMVLQRLETLILSTCSSSSFEQANNDYKDRDLQTLKITLLVQLSLDCPKLEDSMMFLTQAHKEFEDKGGYIMDDIHALYYYAKGILIYRECNTNGDMNTNPSVNTDAIEEKKEISNPTDLTNKLIESSQFLEKSFIYLLQIKARNELKLKISEKLMEIFFKLGDIRKLKKYLNNYIRHMLKIEIANRNEKELLSRLLAICYLYVYIGQFEKIQKKIEEMWHLIPYDYRIFKQYTKCYKLFKFIINAKCLKRKMLFSPKLKKAVSECCFIYRDLEKIYILAELSLQAEEPNACITIEDRKFLSSFDQYKENYLQRKNKVESMMSNPDYTLCSKHLSFEDSGKTCLPLEIKSIKKDNGYIAIKGYGYMVFNKVSKYKGDFIIFIFSDVNTLNDNIIHDIKCLGCFLDTHYKEDNIKTMFIFENGKGIFENSDYRTVKGKQKMSSFEGKVIKNARKFRQIDDLCYFSLRGKEIVSGKKDESDIYEGNYFDSLSNGYGKYKCHGRNQFDCYRRNNLAFGNAALKNKEGKTIKKGNWFYDDLVQKAILN